MTERALQRQASKPDRRPLVAVQRAPVAQAFSPMQALQRRVGDQAMLAVIARAATVQAPPASSSPSAGLRISSPQDAAEREATATAAAVMRTATPVSVSSREGPQLLRAPTKSAAVAIAGSLASPSVTAQISASMSSGAPLSPAVRNFMEPRFGSNFSQVRVHTGEPAAGLSDRVNAKAFTVGGHIFFGRNQYQPERREGRELIAHELTHTVQQGAATPHSIQRNGGPSLSDRISDAAADLAATALPNPGDLVLQALGIVAPGLVPIINGGPNGFAEWLKGNAMSAVEGVFTTLMAPVSAVAGAGQGLTAQFAPVIASLQAAAAQIAKNDCGPIRDAADKIEKAAEKLITPIVETLQPVVAAIKDFLSGVWDKIGAPIWNWIKQYASSQWEQIKAIAKMVSDAAKWLWDNTSAIREVYSQAWTWLKNKLGIGDGPEGEAGILQWVQGKLSAVWENIKLQLAPFTKQLTIIGAAVAGVALALSPAGPILAVGGAIAGAINGIRWIAANWGKGNIIATARVYLEQTLIPPLLDAVGRLSATFTNVAQSISGALNNLAAGMAGAVGVLGGSILSFAVSAVQWIASQVNALAAWANGQLAQLGAWLKGALGKLQTLLKGVLQFFGRVADVIIDIWGLPVLLGEAIWDRVPACVRDPIVDFLGPIILRQIEIFQELAKDNEAWQKTKEDVGKIIKLVFHDHDLMGAVKATFFLILRVFNLPPDLLLTVANKAVAAWDIVVKKPLDFIKNVIRSVGHGFRMLWDNKIENLKIGLQGWLLGEIKEKNIVIPTNWSEPRQLFDFALSVLGISSDHIFELMKKRFPDQTIDKIRAAVGKIAGVVAWVDKAIDTTKSPAENARGMINQAKEFGVTILTGLAEWVAAKVAEEIAIMLAAAAASAGLSEIVDIARRIYRAILTAVRWARRILDMANQALDNVLDIANGAVEKVGATFYKIMQGGLPVVVGFLADQVGLGGVGAAIRGIIDKLREKVDNAILWVIDKIKLALERLVGAVKAGVAAVTEWWTESVSFRDQKGQPHRLFYSGTQDNARLKIASKEVFTDEFIVRVETAIRASPQLRDFAQSKLSSCRTSMTNLARLKQQLAFATRTKDPSLQRLERDHKEEMMRLSTFVGFLMDVLPENAVALAMKAGDKVTIPYKGTERMGQIIVISADRVHYSVDAIAGQLQMPTKEFQEKWAAGIIREYVEEGLREKYLGSTPSKADKTGRDLIEFKYKGKIEMRGGVAFVEWKKGSWHPLADCDMSHEPLDAVDYWNNIGRDTGPPAPKSGAVRGWMLDYRNYILEPSAVNRSRGSRANSKYLPPRR
ncbi:DUF4157 domain-containing protein [Mesorhizobium sp. M0590]|uniref:eCIS core domain-containing protein n=1 Tax=Mesorhizobium sp. M0590 TaxID=2956966 RepID=UPI003339B28B